MDSTDSEEEAISRAHQLTELLRLGGFRITKWLSSTRKVISSIDSKDLTNQIRNLELDYLPIERTLGIRWDIETDTIAFQIPEKT